MFRHTNTTKQKTFIINLFIYSLLILIAVTMKGQNNFDSVVENFKKDKDLQYASYGFCVLDAQTGKIIKELNSETALIPASTLKIITTSAALGTLGTNYTYKTSFFFIIEKDSASNAVKKHLLIKGSGDPSFNSSYFYNNDSIFLTPILTQFKLKGIQNINGKVITDVSIFDNSIPSHWIWGDIGNYFGAGANGLSYRDNKFSLFFRSGANNTPAYLESISPAYFSQKISVTSNVKAGGTDDNAYVFGDPTSYLRYVNGTIPPLKTHYEIEAAMPESGLFFSNQLLIEFKKQNMATINSKAAMTDAPFPLHQTTSELIHTHTSPKLEKIVYYTNVKSNNHYAESLLKTLGAIKSGKQGTTENGIRAVEDYWKERGVDITSMHMADGSGLSRANSITTKTQATILSKIYRDKQIYEAFNASLPIAGKNGSMQNLCKGTFAENNLRAKTGYINRVRGYCGYVKTKKGTELAFSILVNNYSCTPSEMKLKIERFLSALVDL